MQQSIAPLRCVHVHRALCRPLLALLVLAACSDPPPPPPNVAAEATERSISQGRLVGFRDTLGANVWLGIPFATPPVGALRWRAPRPPEPWSGVREALALGSECPQIAGPLAPDSPENTPIGDEDCLYLNVFAPPGAGAGARRPVLFWIHGGGNTVGSANPYSGATLATSRDVVVVTVNYRLGMLGWLRHPALRGESPEDASGNYTVLDLVRALEWVRDEIAHFGGDPERVTIFGESAGGSNVYSLLLSPRAGGLFQRAIVQSGGLWMSTPAEAENLSDADSPGRSSSSAEMFLALLMADGRAADRAAAKRVAAEMTLAEQAAYWRGKSAGELLGVYAEGGFGGMYEIPALIRDGHVLPAQEGLAAFRAGAYNRVPVILGTNRDESKLFSAFGSEHVTHVFQIPLWINDERLYDLENEYPTLVWKARGVDEPATAMRASGAEDVYAYRFDWDEEPTIFFADLSKLFGAAHALEIPFVFGRLRFVGLEELIFDEDERESDEKLMRAMTSYWTEFARIGKPGRGREGELPAWSAWDAAPGARFMVLDTEDDGGLRMSAESVTVRAVVDRIATDERFRAPEERCAIYRELTTRWEAIEPEEYAALAGDHCEALPIGG